MGPVNSSAATAVVLSPKTSRHAFTGPTVEGFWAEVSCDQDARADLEVKDKLGQTPLHLAVKQYIDEKMVMIHDGQAPAGCRG